MIIIKNVSPYVKICLTFLVVILIGALLLMLPISVNEGYESLSFIDALFMATTTTCVTGLTVVENAGLQMSIFGKVVLALLIEIGGLSFITIFTFFIIMAGRKIGISDTFLLKESLNRDSLKNIFDLVKKIIIMTLTIQGFGVLLNFLALMGYDDNLWNVFGVSIFHTIASFNNSGLDIFGCLAEIGEAGNGSMIPLASDVFVNINTMILIILGGLGFVIIDDIIHKRRWKKFNINTKIVLIMTIILIFGGAVFLKLSNISRTWLECFLMSISCRTAGFQSIDCGTINTGEFCVMNFLMFIGASPGSTGGGIKTATFFVIMITIISYALGKRPVIFKREIAKDTIVKAMALTITAILMCVLAIFMICLFNPELSAESIIFEVISAFSTTGLTMGITRQLVWGSKLIIIFMMYFGRLGPLTVISIINKNWKLGGDDKKRYIDEKVVIG